MVEQGQVEEEEIKKALLEASENGRIRCPQCLEIARRFQVKGTVVGRLCNELKLKICGCQLGCFK